MVEQTERTNPVLSKPSQGGELSDGLPPEESPRLQETSPVTAKEYILSSIWELLVASNRKIAPEIVFQMLKEKLRIIVAIDQGTSTTKMHSMQADGTFSDYPWRRAKSEIVTIDERQARIMTPEQLRENIEWIQEMIKVISTEPESGLVFPVVVLLTSYQHSLAVQVVSEEEEISSFALLCDPTLNPVLSDQMIDELRERGLSEPVVELLTTGKRSWLTKLVTFFRHNDDFRSSLDIPQEAEFYFSTVPGYIASVLSGGELGIIPDSESALPGCSEEDLHILCEYFGFSQDCVTIDKEQDCNGLQVEMIGDLQAELLAIQDFLERRGKSETIVVSTDSVGKIFVTGLNGKPTLSMGGFKQKENIDAYYSTTRYGAGGTCMFLKPVLIAASDCLELDVNEGTNFYNLVDRLCNGWLKELKQENPLPSTDFYFAPMENGDYLLLDTEGNKHELMQLVDSLVQAADKEKLEALLMAIINGSAFSFREMIQAIHEAKNADSGSNGSFPNEVAFYGGLLPHSNEGRGLLGWIIASLPHGTSILQLPFDTAVQAALYNSSINEVAKNDGVYLIKPIPRKPGRLSDMYQVWKEYQKSLIEEGMLVQTTTGGVTFPKSS
ncbi:MAG: hypothetical protein XD95_0281 [Microgenomates bacterium 39_7]|nr:MAG: hypothetical protein XD95_0281 [Microgenomates bacterium 39_7]